MCQSLDVRLLERNWITSAVLVSASSCFAGCNHNILYREVCAIWICLPIWRDRHPTRGAAFSTMKNELRINVYVWADFSASTSRVDVRLREEGDATGGRHPVPLSPQPGRGVLPPRAATRLIACRAQPLYILTGVLTPASRFTVNFLYAT